MRAALARITCPALIVYGRKGPNVADRDRLESAAPAIAIQVLEGSGHFPMLDDPKSFTECLLDFAHRDRQKQDAALDDLVVVRRPDTVVADDPAAFAVAVIDLLRDPARAAAIGAAGRALAERAYSWPVVAQPMLDAWAAVASGQWSVVSGQHV